jgi:hypothetical protein
MESLSSLNAAAQLVSRAMATLNAVRERSQLSQDAELKQHISTLHDELLALKEAVIRVTKENAELRKPAVARKQKPELRKVGSANFYFDGEKGPCCQPCFDTKGLLAVLSEPEKWSGGVRRQCFICKEYFYEQPMHTGQAARRKPYSWS